MQPELAIIATDFLKDFVNDSMKEINWDGKYTIYSYNTFKDIPEIYKSIPERVQGIVTSGSFPAQVINHSFPESEKIIRPFNNDDAGLYKLFLQILYHNRNIEMNRIYADLLDIGKINIYEYLLGKRKSDISIFIANEIEKMSLDQLLNAEEEYARKHLELWKNGEIDVSITRFSSIMHQLQDSNLPIYFAYPSLSYVEYVCLATAQEVTIKNLRENQPSAILVNPAIEKDAEDMEKRQKALLRAVNRFSNVMQIDYLVQKEYLGCEILTNRKTVETITDGFSICKLQAFLKSKLDFDVHIGYGIGATLYQARINAVDANREASLSLSSSSCLINEKDELIFSLKGLQPFVISRNISEPVKKLSKISGLSTLTIQKVFSVAKTMEGHKITSEEMSHKLAITQRSANRFLSSLKNCGLAEVVEQRQSTTKGRPILVYKIFVDKLDSL
ncbi:hypothetical protein [Anaeropeptidivorans aminofermentans]|jgi:hypothetical protein|uniref:hypothetical protein n=1 Tax=Anaeropeptidivorans aminofermentans TaxID=2934315 RepID=UPI002025352B|nr:hypothetical protein [Anaeropeptidivorans aminofermentans]MBE6012729.1 hypothetical protein [Lachnospiraceae bacterium]